MKRNVSKFNRIVVFIATFLLVGQSVFASPTKVAPIDTKSMQGKIEKLKSKTIPIGKVQKNKEDFKVGDIYLPSYNCMNVSYIVVSDLKKVGGNVGWDAATGKTIIHDLDQPKIQNPQFEKLAQDAMGYLGRDSIYINYQEIPAIFVDGKALIPAKWIPSLLVNKKSTVIKTEPEIENTKNEIEEINLEEINLEEIKPEEIDLDLEALVEVEADLEEKVEEIEELEEIEEVKELEEITPEEIKPHEKGVKGINIWFNGKDYLEERYNFSDLKVGEFGYYKDLRYREKTAYSYVGFVISSVDGVPNVDGDIHKAWLKHAPYYTVPEEVVPEAIVPEVIMALFPDTRVKGIMKYAAGGFAKGETVNVKQASSGSSYHLINSAGKTVVVPWGSVAIQKSPVTKEQATTQEIENYVNSKNFASKTNYFVWTDIYRQRTYVFQGSKNNWKLIKNFLCSTGKDTNLTPVGSYTLNVRVPSFGGSQYRVKNAYAFIGTSYLYHSVLYDKTGTYLLSSWGKLGNKASSGCIRLAPEDSVWFYKTLPIGTGVFIN